MSEMDMQSLRLHHIGVVVKNAKLAAARYSLINACRLGCKYENVESQKVNICLVEARSNVFIEFIEPSCKGSPVFSFSENGGGLHHLCFEVDDIQKAIDGLKPHMRIIVKPVIGFEHRMIAFLFLREDTLGVQLIELAEKRKNQIQDRR